MVLDMEPSEIVIRKEPLTEKEVEQLNSIGINKFKKKGTYETIRGLLIVNNGVITGTGVVKGDLGEPDISKCTNIHTLKKAKDWLKVRKEKWEKVADDQGDDEQ